MTVNLNRTVVFRTNSDYTLTFDIYRSGVDDLISVASCVQDSRGRIAGRDVFELKPIFDRKSHVLEEFFGASPALEGLLDEITRRGLQIVARSDRFDMRDSLEIFLRRCVPGFNRTDYFEVLRHLLS